MIERYNSNRHDTQAVKNLLSLSIGSPTPERLSQLLDEFYTSDGHSIFVALRDGIIIGIIGIDHTAGPHGIMTHLAVKTEMWKQGIGRNLINQAVQVLNLTEMTLETDQDAVDFYRACGFEVKEIKSKWPGIHRFRCSRGQWP